jgi:GGDEF domain-containing protein
MRDQTPISLILADVDFFKNYNDAHGHLQGDQCLIAVAAILQQQIQRPADLVARFGGEEFAVILADTDAEGPSMWRSRCAKRWLTCTWNTAYVRSCAFRDHELWSGVHDPAAGRRGRRHGATAAKGGPGHVPGQDAQAATGSWSGATTTGPITP